MYTLKREGEFFCLPKAGCNHCGIDDKQRRFKYRYEIRAQDNGLDDAGFVIDNKAPQAWFDAIQVLEDSCEILVQRAALAFAALCKSPHTITVAVQPFDGAWVEYEFDCTQKEREIN